MQVIHAVIIFIYTKKNFPWHNWHEIIRLHLICRWLTIMSSSLYVSRVDHCILAYRRVQLYDYIHFPAICEQSCLNGGTCTAPDVCTCRSGWTGSRCERGVYLVSFYDLMCSVNTYINIRLLVFI